LKTVRESTLASVEVEMAVEDMVRDVVCLSVLESVRVKLWCRVAMPVIMRSVVCVRFGCWLFEIRMENEWRGGKGGIYTSPDEGDEVD
jgi:hypothetical protein